MRERYIDIVKGLSILSIVLLHYEQGVFSPSAINTFIGSYMISAFYVCAGWVQAMRPSQRSFKELLKKRWQQLGVPYLWWTAIILLFDSILWACGYYDIYFIGREAYKAVVLRGIGTLWFLPALFGGEVIWFWVRKHKSLWFVFLALVSTFCYQQLYGYLFGGKTDSLSRIIEAPFHTISNMMSAWVGIAFGYGAYKICHRHLLWQKSAVLATVGAILCAFAYYCANYLPSWLAAGWDLLAPLLGPLGLLLLAKAFQKSSLLTYFDYWGRNSLCLMVTHYNIIAVLFYMIVDKWLCLPYDGWITLVGFFLSMPLQHLLVLVIDRYIPFTLGK